MAISLPSRMLAPPVLAPKKYWRPVPGTVAEWHTAEKGKTRFMIPMFKESFLRSHTGQANKC